jgi:DNA-binding PadR family transcriptional regulator
MSKDNKTIYVILGLLNHEDLTGYDIKQKIDLSLSFFWNAGFGQIYPTLKVMEQNGLVLKKEEAGEGRKRIIYTITEAGREELKKWLLVPAENEDLKYEILLKLFFGSTLKAEENINLISEFKGRSQDTLNILNLYRSNLEKVLKDDKDHLYYYLTVLFGQKIYKAYMEWSEEATKLLQGLKAEEDK